MPETSVPSAGLALCLLGSVLVTLLPKVLPLTLLKGDRLPTLLREWLSFVPVAVMAALVGGDVFFYGGHFSAGMDNLFLMVSLPSLLVAWWWRNYFVTIAFGLALIIVLRAWGLY